MRTGLGMGLVVVASSWAGGAPVVAQTAPSVDTTVEVTRGRANSLDHEQQVPLRVEFRNEFGERFRLNQLLLLIDGEVVSEHAAGRDGELQNRFLAHAAEVPAGLHSVEVRAVLVGKSGGLFSYLEGYRLHVRAMRAIEPEVGKPGVLTVVMEKQGGWTSPIEEQVRLRFDAAPGMNVDVPARAGTRAVR
jgi:hypothetical protein